MKVIGLIKVLDATAFEAYRNQVGATMAPYQGEVIFRGKVSEIAWNELNCEEFEAVVELSFPSERAARAWMESPEYSKILAIRSEAIRVTLFTVLA